MLVVYGVRRALQDIMALISNTIIVIDWLLLPLLLFAAVVVELPVCFWSTDMFLFIKIVIVLSFFLFLQLFHEHRSWIYLFVIQLVCCECDGAR